MKHIVFSIISIWILLISGKESLADPVIFDNGTPVGAGVISDPRYPQFEADNFILGSGNYLTDIHWWGFYGGNPGEDNFTIQIYKFDGALPELTPIYEISPGAQVNRKVVADSNIYAYYVIIDSIYLEPNTSYLLSIVNKTNTDNPLWSWCSSSKSGVESAFTYYRYSYTDSWIRDSYNELAFYLTGALKVGIEIIPDRINPKSGGKTTIAILSTEGFNAPIQVNQNSLTFGRTGDEKSLAFCSPHGEDINKDGLPDLVCYFYTYATGFQCGDTDGILKGKTVDGNSINGNDLVSIGPCK